MSWKRVITGSGGDDGRVLPQDLITAGLTGTPAGTPDAADIGKVLKISSAGNNGELTWTADNAYAHPSNYTPFNIAIDTSATANVASGGWVVSALATSLVTDNSGHVTTATGSVSRREMSLADLGYTGAADANKYQHPTEYDINTHPGYAQSIDINLSNNSVLRALKLERTTNAAGHVTHHDMTHTLGTVVLEDLGYHGSPLADQYDNWKVNVQGGTAVDVLSGHEVRFRGGDNIAVSQASSGNMTTVTVSAQPAGIGKIESVTAGAGMSFTTVNDSTPDGIISMATPGTLSSITENTNPDGGSHTHEITTTSDGSTSGSTETILQTDEDGKLTVENLEVASNISVNGDEVVLGSSEVQIEDASIQLNFDIAGGGTAYNTHSAAVIFGHNTATTGAKIINHISATGQHFMAFTDLPDFTTEPPANGGTAAFGGDAKSIKSGPLSLEGRLICNELDAQGSLDVGSNMTVGSTLRMGSLSTEPSADTTGEMYFDGANLWVNT